MGRYGARLRALEVRLMPPEGQQHPTVIWTITDTDNPPEWAEEAIRPHLPAAGVVMVQWHQSQQAGEYCVDINGRWYSVTEVGAESIEPPITLTLDNPNDVDVRPVTPVQARDMLRSVGL